MLVQTNKGSSTERLAIIPSGIRDSPTLARVERAMLRHERGSNLEDAYYQRANYTQSLLSNFGMEKAHAIKRGLLWQQRDKLFSRWKERYFILTRDYLHCFRRASGSDKISEMGQFLFKVKLVEVDKVKWENKKTFSTIALILGRDGKIYLRAADGLEDWFELLEECTLTSKERRRALRYSHSSNPSRENNNITPSLDEWLAARQKSLLTDVDTYDDSTLGAPSTTSYRLNQDVFCIQSPSLRGSDSFRSTRESFMNSKRNLASNTIQDSSPCQFIKFRERSYSDMLHVGRRPWRVQDSKSSNFQ